MIYFRLFIFLLIPAIFIHCAGNDARQQATDEHAAINRCLKLSGKKRYAEAIECLEIFKSRYPASALASEAELRIADGYFRKKDYLLAAESYQQFIRLHPSHERADYAYYRLGLSYLNSTPNAIDRDQQSLPDAITAFETVWQSFPTSPYAKISLLKYKEALYKMGRQDFYIARFYYRTKEYRAAIPRLAAILEDYTNTDLSKEAAYLKVRSHLVLGEIEPARDALAYLQAHFPNDKLTSKAVGYIEKAGKNKKGGR